MAGQHFSNILQNLACLICSVFGFSSNIGTNDQGPTFDASKALHVSAVSLKWILLTMIHYKFPELLSHEEISTQAFLVIEFINFSLFQVAKSTDKKVYWAIWFIFQLLGFEILLWIAVYTGTSIVVNLCLVIYTLVKIHYSEGLWSRLKEIFLPPNDQPFTTTDSALEGTLLGQPQESRPKRWSLEQAPIIQRHFLVRAMEGMPGGEMFE